MWLSSLILALVPHVDGREEDRTSSRFSPPSTMATSELDVVGVLFTATLREHRLIDHHGNLYRLDRNVRVIAVPPGAQDTTDLMKDSSATKRPYSIVAIQTE